MQRGHVATETQTAPPPRAQGLRACRGPVAHAAMSVHDSVTERGRHGSHTDGHTDRAPPPPYSVGMEECRGGGQRDRHIHALSSSHTHTQARWWYSYVGVPCHLHLLGRSWRPVRTGQAPHIHQTVTTTPPESGAVQCCQCRKCSDAPTLKMQQPHRKMPFTKATASYSQCQLRYNRVQTKGWQRSGGETVPVQAVMV